MATVDLMILTGKQDLQNELRYTQKLWIPKFPKFMYKKQYFLDELTNLTGF